jgi:hypothetical protein
MTFVAVLTAHRDRETDVLVHFQLTETSKRETATDSAITAANPSRSKEMPRIIISRYLLPWPLDDKYSPTPLRRFDNRLMF